MCSRIYITFKASFRLDNDLCTNVRSVLEDVIDQCLQLSAATLDDDCWTYLVKVTNVIDECLDVSCKSYFGAHNVANVDTSGFDFTGILIATFHHIYQLY